MEKLTSLTAVAAPLPIDNCATDQIMPKQFLRGIDKSGLARGVFFNMRCNPDGSPRADCVFNRPGFEKTAIICAGPNFGCGSSREHAVWGLMQMGIRAVIASGFGEIFYSNCFNNGLLALRHDARRAHGRPGRAGNPCGRRRLVLRGRAETPHHAHGRP